MAQVENESLLTHAWHDRLNLGLAAASGLLGLSLALGAVKLASAQEQAHLDITTRCAPVESPFGQTLFPPRIEVSILGEFRPMPVRPLIPVGKVGNSNVVAPSEVVWLTLEDTLTARNFTLTWSSVESGRISATMNGYLDSVRRVTDLHRIAEKLPGDKNFIRPFVNYRAHLGVGQFRESEAPIVTRSLTEATFSSNCTHVPGWALPKGIKEQKDREVAGYPPGVYAI